MIQALVDMNNLSALLLVSPDVTDAPRAPPLRLADPAHGARLEFADVEFSYPSAPSSNSMPWSLLKKFIPWRCIRCLSLSAICAAMPP